MRAQGGGSGETRQSLVLGVAKQSPPHVLPPVWRIDFAVQIISEAFKGKVHTHTFQFKGCNLSTVSDNFATAPTSLLCVVRRAFPRAPRPLFENNDAGRGASVGCWTGRVML